ncbi:TRAP transporter substrate-binding protein [Salinispira pacifica]
MSLKRHGPTRRGRPSWIGRLGLLAALLLLPVVGAYSLELKIASIAPENSPYGRALQKLAADWQKISEGNVRVRLYHNGIAGDQSDILRKIRIGQLQGGIFTNAGVAPITSAALSVSVPFLIRSDAEFRYVMKDLRPVLDSDFEDSGFKLVAWAEAGWLYIFSRNRVTTPDQMQGLRLGVPAREEDLVNTFKAIGYRPIPLDTTQVLTALNSGMTDAVISSPLLVAGYQWFAIARNMLDLKIAPAAGCILLSRRAWDRVPSRYRDGFLRAAAAAERTLESGLDDLDSKAIKAMTSYGLNIVTPTPAQTALWEKEFENNREAIIRSSFDEQTVKTIEKDLAEYRAGR